MKYRKKPVVVEAEQFFPDEAPWPKGVCQHLPEPNPSYLMQTLEGPFSVKEGDWIITGVRGEKYPCKPDIFEATYERVEDDGEFTAQ
jgi:hypothetical protein